MDEAEVAEAYRDRMLRELAALQPLAGGDGEGTGPSSRFSADVEARIHRGLTESELALWREESGGETPPGWMAVVVTPQVPLPGLIVVVATCSGPGVDVGIPVNVATVDGWKTTRTGLDSRGEDLVGGVL